MKIMVFPGQGSQKIGMVKDLYDRFDLVKNLFKTAEEVSSLPLSNLIFAGSEQDLTDTKVSQVAIMLASVSVLRVLQELTQKEISELTDYVAGHSLGEYSALVASDALSFADAVELLKVRGAAMAQAYPQGGGMLAVIGLKESAVVAELAQKAEQLTGKVCEVANDNAIGQVILSGNLEALEQAARLAKEEYKAKMVKMLEVSGPFHSSLMVPAQAALSSALNEVTVKTPAVKFIANVSAGEVQDAIEIKNLLLQQLIKPVRWVESMHLAVAQGVNQLIEVGPKNVLAGLMKRIDPAVKITNLESLEQLEGWAL